MDFTPIMERDVMEIQALKLNASVTKFTMDCIVISRTKIHAMQCVRMADIAVEV